MARFLLTRLGLAAITLFLLSVLVFVGANLLPGNVARRKLGNLADQSAVDQLNHQLGTDKPILVQYWNWISGLLHGDLGTSLSYNLPVSQLIGPALTQFAQARRVRLRHGRAARDRRRRRRGAEAGPAH